MTINEAIREKILILDGAMGTMIQRYDLQEEDFRNDELKDHNISLKGNNDLLSLTRPDIIKSIHESYLEVGADIIETNTFSSTTIAQADYGLQDLVYKINYKSARIAREAADRFTSKNLNQPRFVAGSIGPTNTTASLSPNVNDPGYRAVTFDELKLAFRLQVEALLDGGVDLLLFETIIDTLNAKAALNAAVEVKSDRNIQTPIMVSGTITDASGRTLSGQTTEAFLISISHCELFSVGLNCAFGAEMMRPFLKVLSEKSEFMVSAHPNAGLPNEFGQYDETPEEMVDQIIYYLEDRMVNIIGGCCGTTPEHIQAIATMAKNYKPRKIEYAL